MEREGALVGEAAALRHGVHVTVITRDIEDLRVGLRQLLENLLAMLNLHK